MASKVKHRLNIFLKKVKLSLHEFFPVTFVKIYRLNSDNSQQMLIRFTLRYGHVLQMHVAPRMYLFSVTL